MNIKDFNKIYIRTYKEVELSLPEFLENIHVSEEEFIESLEKDIETSFKDITEDQLRHYCFENFDDEYLLEDILQEYYPEIEIK